MDLYENPSQPIEARIADLLNQMTVEEKADHGRQTMDDRRWTTDDGRP